MKLAFCILNYFPFGGLQRDFMRIAQICQQRGHDVHVFTLNWQGDKPPGFNITEIPVSGFTNHARCRSFAKQLSHYLEREKFSLVIGFNRLPNLDIYFAGDLCYAHAAQEKHGLLYRWTPRYRLYSAYEKSVFSPQSKTQIFILSPTQQAHYIQQYQTPAERFHLLPPGIDRSRAAPNNASVLREKKRTELGYDETYHLLLMVASSFKTKGVDRAIKSLAALPLSMREKTRLLIIGKDNPTFYQKLAKQLQVFDQCHFLGGRHDVLDFFLAADLFIHPAHREAAGLVLIEALATGLPALVTDHCGYAFHIQTAQAGIITPTPFQQITLNEQLLHMLNNLSTAAWKKNALDYAKTNDLFSLPEKAADFIEQYEKQPLGNNHGK